MKINLILFLSIFFLEINSQITQLNSGTSTTLNHLSVINNTVYIGGLSGNYLVKTYDEGDHLIPLPCPGPTLNNAYLQRLDKDTLFMLSYLKDNTHPLNNNAHLYKSTDGGNNWTKEMDTTSFVPNCFAFFNSKEGIIDKATNGFLLRTTNGGSAWTTTTSPLDVIYVAKTFGDSMIIIGGDFGSLGRLFLSKNRGISWPYASSMGGYNGSNGVGGFPRDFSFVNADTIFGVSSRDQIGSSHFTRTTNGGQSWQNGIAPLYYSNGIYFRKSNEGYILGSDIQNNGIVARTNDLGQSWSTFNTGVLTSLTNIVFLSDSIALLSGTNGVLLRWNYKNSVFTGLDEGSLNDEAFSVFPNPVKDKLIIHSNDSRACKVALNTILGQVIYSAVFDSNKSEIDLTWIPRGIYFIKLETENNQRIIKIIKD